MRGASPVRLVSLLYEQAIEDLRRALKAHRDGDIEARTRGINHALLVLGQLQGSLNRERGGRAAENLERFYNEVRAGLIEAQRRQSDGAIQQQITDLMRVREAWAEVEQAEAQVPSSQAAPSGFDVPNSDAPHSLAEWKA